MKRLIPLTVLTLPLSAVPFAELNHILGETYGIYTDLSDTSTGLYEMPGWNAHFGVRVSLCPVPRFP
jgi:hypothetical protein